MILLVMIVTTPDLQQFISVVRSNSSYDFSDYSDKSLKRRLAKVLVDNKMDLTALLSQIKVDGSFLEKVVKDITVNTTELFRDPQIWQYLIHVVLPKFKDQANINIWHAGCSSGQEVYSMMMALHKLGMLDKARIYASDLNADMLSNARKGVYRYRFNINYLDNFDKALKENPFNFEEYDNIPYERYFVIDKEKDYIRMNPFLVEKPIYKKHDLVSDPNIFYVKFDLILCRNVIIYFGYELQNKVFDLFYNNLYNNGYLWLGMHESILGPFASRFEKTGNFYQKKEQLFYSP